MLPNRPSAVVLILSVSHYKQGDLKIIVSRPCWGSKNALRKHVIAQHQEAYAAAAQYYCTSPKCYCTENSQYT